MNKPVPPPVALAMLQVRIQETRIEIAGLPRGSASWRAVRQALEQLVQEQAELTQLCSRFEHQLQVMHETAEAEGIKGMPFFVQADAAYPTGN